MGDGSYVKGSNPILFNCDQEVLDYVANNYETVDCKRSHVTKDGRLFKALRINKIRESLRNLGIYGQTKLNKRLPEKYFHVVSMIVVSYLLDYLTQTDA